ncbi:hypothetical protein [Pontibacter sp. H249]|uniref:hypothetical protein n=1 Tax=Pontibacter sp. H249 TaxID=3133420 RepID=UPI0030BFC83D
MSHWQYLISIAFTWTGFVCAISFLEAWLKFRAPGVTLPIGLSIGRLIFRALNKVEWFFALAATLLVFYGNSYKHSETIYLAIPILLLLLQTIWLLPAMDKRAELIISGAELPRSTLHFYYIGAELIKVISLVIFGVQLFR